MSKDNLKKLAKRVVIQGAIGAVIGAIGGTFLSSSLMMGGFVAIFPALFAVSKLYSFYAEKKEFKQDSIRLSIITAACIAIGVGLGAAAGAIFPGVMLGMWSAVLAGAVIGFIAPPVAALATNHIILPIIKWIGERFNSKESQYEINLIC